MNGITLDEKDLKRLCNKMCQSHEKCNEVVCNESNFNTTNERHFMVVALNRQKMIMNTTRMIDNIMDYFDFNKVKKTMEKLDWRWGRDKAPPCEGELREHARKMLENIVKQDCLESSCGGFHVYFDGEILKLIFEVSSWESSSEE